MKPISPPLALLLGSLALATAAGAAALTLGSDPAHAAGPLAPAAHSAPAAGPLAPARESRTGLGTAASYAPPGTPLGEDALAAIRAAALERVERERNQTLFERQRAEGDWLRVLANEVAASAGLDGGAGQLLAAILIRERDDQSALWEQLRSEKNKRAARRRLAHGMSAIRDAKHAALEATFGAERAAELQALLDEGGPGADGEPGALARAGY